MLLGPRDALRLRGTPKSEHRAGPVDGRGLNSANE